MPSGGNAPRGRKLQDLLIGGEIFVAGILHLNVLEARGLKQRAGPGGRGEISASAIFRPRNGMLGLADRPEAVFRQRKEGPRLQHAVGFAEERGAVNDVHGDVLRRRRRRVHRRRADADRLYRRHRFPPEVISYAVWLYFWFPLSLRMVEEMLAARGICVTYETVRQWGRSLARHLPIGSASVRPLAATNGISTEGIVNLSEGAAEGG